MKRALLAGLPLLLLASPALATGGIDCRATDRSGIELFISFGNGRGWNIDGALLLVGDQSLQAGGDDTPLMVVRRWNDFVEIRIELADRQTEQPEAVMRARWRRGVATGTLVRRGVSHPVRCVMEDMTG